MDNERERVRKLEAQSQGFSVHLIGILEVESQKKMEENLGDSIRENLRVSVLQG